MRLFANKENRHSSKKICVLKAILRDIFYFALDQKLRRKATCMARGLGLVNRTRRV
uniref:Uncharacterized protein n=1 Tax=Zymomonas mobilis subsp. mobilis (strain ATCC 31821 / ZM4 / CP4) TaxID=264203 RepID=A0A806CE00_ZYMMO|nr:hypothetical protein ZZM4_0081 [Zymomonas mobilis subsp. mobilis ZM4 = ATCC 31821]